MFTQNTCIVGAKGEQQNRAVQEKLFEMGYRWWAGTSQGFYDIGNSNYFVSIEDNKIRYDKNPDWYKGYDHQITATEFLGERKFGVGMKFRVIKDGHTVFGKGDMVEFIEYDNINKVLNLRKKYSKICSSVGWASEDYLELIEELEEETMKTDGGGNLNWAEEEPREEYEQISAREIYKKFNISNKPKNKLMTNVINFVEEKALKLTNPDLYELYKAGLANKCGELTDEGNNLKHNFLEKLVYADMVATAKEINEENAKNKK